MDPLSEYKEGTTFPSDVFQLPSETLVSWKFRAWTNPLVLKILERHNYLCTVCDMVIVYCWIPRHTGIQGNELADQAVNDGLDKRITNILFQTEIGILTRF